ncbi:cupin domain-containing protein [Croceibacterium sp. LX-88]|uniref:Cupin domain-containing protein n=1 Tax=Croceibacterium selenioxidans TaxID=2838833 RepID=A0ABS5W0K9_9SPHN|nr:cupin domain-containing protein [Croceibacterium selenioxidans]MBT2132765.1 cupin domain-containing protein [Croceibacterium selenioxidans]
MEMTSFDHQQFLREFWQKKPLLIRNPWKSWSNPLEPDELAGLACESEVESRLVTLAADNWELKHGPLAESQFGRLGRAPWTLLVQAVDHHVPSVAALLEPFRFIPNWRVDDVMVSYATDGGGVGPHFDQYDVFLVQGLGKRLWQLGATCGPDAELLSHDDLRLLANFEATEEWLLEPGDILYVPPRVAHNGIAVGDDCMTYSVGFRAPSRTELITDLAEAVAADLEDDDRYSDPNLTAQDNPGEISPEAIEHLLGMVAERMLDRDAFTRWFAGYSTTPKRPEISWQPDDPFAVDDVRRILAEPAQLLRNPASRFAFVRQESGSVLLAVDGHCFDCAGETTSFAERLAGQERVSVGPDASEPTVELITILLNQGSVAFDEED